MDQDRTQDESTAAPTPAAPGGDQEIGSSARSCLVILALLLVIAGVICVSSVVRWVFG